MTKLFKNESNLFYDFPISILGLAENASLSLDQFFRVLEFIDEHAQLTKTAIRHQIEPELQKTVLDIIIRQLTSIGWIEVAESKPKKLKQRYLGRHLSLDEVRRLYPAHYQITDKGRQLLQQVQGLYEFPAPDGEPEPQVIV